MKKSFPYLVVLRRILALAAGAWLALLFFRQGVVKLDPEGFWTGAFERWGYPAWLRTSVGIIESAGAPFS